MTKNNRIKEIIGSMAISDIKLLLNDLKSHNHSIKLMEDILNKYDLSKKVCATCGIPINPFSDETCSITLGSPGFQKRAFFDGTDCMKHFIEKYDHLKKSQLR